MDIIGLINELINNPNDLALLSSSGVFLLLAITRLAINRRKPHSSTEVVSKEELRPKLVIESDRISRIRLRNLRLYATGG